MQHEGMHLGWPRVSVACDYFGPVRFEDEVMLNLRVTKVGDKSFNYEVDYLLGERRVALGKITSVCCVLENGKMKSISIPEPLRAKINS
jgi:4-hydroxybenzoyl-CoA thioesterase/acyl-CoA thioester hydrolase